MSYLKPQDVRLLCLLIANSKFRNAKQSELASELKISSSTINKSLKRLESVGLISKSGLWTTGNDGMPIWVEDIKYCPNPRTSDEFLKKSIKYVFYDHPDILELANNTNTLFVETYRIN